MTDWAFPQGRTGESLVAVAIILRCFLGDFFQRYHPQKLPTVFQFFFSVAVAEETVVADAMKALGQHMEEEAADKLIGRQGQVFC